MHSTHAFDTPGLHQELHLNWSVSKQPSKVMQDWMVQQCYQTTELCCCFVFVVFLANIRSKKTRPHDSFSLVNETDQTDELIFVAGCSDAECKAEQGTKLPLPACLPVCLPFCLSLLSVYLFCLSVSLSVFLFLLSSSLKRTCGKGSRISNARSCTRLGGYVNLPLMYTHSHTGTHTHTRAHTNA